MADTDHNRQDSLAPRILLPMAGNKAQVEDLELLSGFVVRGVPHEFQATLAPVNLLALGCQATKTFEEVVTGEGHADLLWRDGERVRVHPESASKLVSRWQVGSEKLLAGQRKEAILRNRPPKPSTLILHCCLANSTSTHPSQPSSFNSVCEPALLTRSACCRSLRYLPICFAVGTKHAGTLPALSSRRRKRLGAPSSLESRSFTARWRFRSSCLDSPPDEGRFFSRTKQSYVTPLAIKHNRGSCHCVCFQVPLPLFLLLPPACSPLCSSTRSCPGCPTLPGYTPPGTSRKRRLKEHAS